MKVQNLEPFLKGASCFAVLDDDQLRLVRDRLEVRSYKLGQVVFRQGDPGDSMYLVYSGKVRVLREQDGQEIPLNTLYPGEHFGELALVSGQPRSATIRAAADSTLITVPAAAVCALLERNAHLRRYFDDYARRLELWNFIKLVVRIGKQLRPAQLRRLIDRFQSQTVAGGETILAEGQVPERFYLIQSGRVEVLCEGRRHATLTAGDSFGAGPLLQEPPGRSRWSIRADGPVELLALAAADFRRLLDEVPGLRGYFEEQLAHYRAEEAPEHFRHVSAQVAGAESRQAGSEVGQAAGAAAGEVSCGAVAAELPAPEVRPAVAAPARPAPRRRPALFTRLWLRWRFPFCPQHEETDCGAACLAMVTAWHGHPVGVSRMRDLAGVSAEGATLAQLAEAAHQVGYRTKAMRISADRLEHLRLPAVLLWKGFHYVVLYALSGRHGWIADPAFGKERLVREDLAEYYSGFALELEPTEAVVRVRQRPSAARRMAGILRGHARTLGAVIAGTFLLKLCGLAFPEFTQRIIDRLVPGQGLSGINQVLLIVILVSLLQILISVWQGLTTVRLSQVLDRKLLDQFYGHLLSLPVRFFKLRRTGDIVARFSDNENVRALFTGGTMTVIIESPMMLIYFAIMFYKDPRLAALVFAFIPLLAGYTMLVSPVMKRQLRRVLEDQAAHESNLIETVRGIDLVKAMAIERPVRTKWQRLFSQFLASSFRSARLEQVFGAFGGALNVLSTLALLWYGAVLVNRGDGLTKGELVAFTMYAGLALGPVMKLVGLWDELQQARVSLERLNDVLDSEPEPQRPPGARLVPEIIRGHVRFDNVFFHYGNLNAGYVLRGISFEAQPGCCIAIVGRSGSGKTTLARLLLGLYPPTEGHVYIDGWDLADLDLATYRRQVGVVLQENLLFSGTIRDNIALGDPYPNMERVEEAASLAGAAEFIAAMPLGYETVVGELGLTLSGGQRQRISLARALYRNPRILVLDEATSALDSLSEREIQKNLGTILAGRTAFVIAHKIATVRNADHILVLHDGVIVEQGNHDELMARRGTYYYLAAQQLNL